MMVVTRRAPCFSWEGNKFSGDTARGQITCNHIKPPSCMQQHATLWLRQVSECVETPPFHQAILTFRQKYLLACNFILYKFVLASECYIVKTSGNSSDNITFTLASFFKVHLPPCSLSMTLQPHLEHPNVIFLSLMLCVLSWVRTLRISRSWSLCYLADTRAGIAPPKHSATIQS